MKRWDFYGRILSAITVVAMLGGCAGLEQFPDRSDGKDADVLKDLDADYSDAINEIYGKGQLTEGDTAQADGSSDGGSTESDADSTKNATKVKRDPPTPDVQKQIRNEFIETRLAVIDVHFQAFVRKLARDNAHADLLVALAEVGVGGAGAVVSGGTSQILSAISGGLAGGKEAFDKATLYDKTLTALIAQMVATRQQVAARIHSKWQKGVDDYPLWLARQDIVDYEFAGSLPGAIVATAKDAQVKSENAEQIILGTIGADAVTQEAFAERKTLIQRIDGLQPQQAKDLVASIQAEFPNTTPFITAQYPKDVADSDKDGSTAKLLLKRLVSLTALGPEERKKWDAAIDAI